MSLYTTPQELNEQALDFFLKEGVLRFGEFTLKSGRSSPYFFNTGLLCSGEQLRMMGRLYASKIAMIPESQEATILFGSAYKGIPIAVSSAIALAEGGGKDMRSVSDRKEAKTHGDKGGFLGVINPGDKAIIVDDVITDGATKIEAIEKLREAEVAPVALIIAFDREEPAAGGTATAVETFAEKTGIPVYPLLTLSNVIEARPDYEEVLRRHLATFQ